MGLGLGSGLGLGLGLGLELGLELGLKVEHHALPQQRLRLVHAHRERLRDIGEI